MSDLDGLGAILAEMDSPLSLFEGFFHTCPMGLQIYGVDGHSLYVNEAFRNLFGVVPPPEYCVLRDEIAEKSGALPLIHRAFRGETVELPITWYDPRELSGFELGEGRRIAMESKAVPIFNRDRKVTHVLFMFTDVTAEELSRQERSKVIKQLNDANTLIRELLDGTHAVIYFKGLDSSFLLVNRQFEKIFNLKSEQILGKNGHDLFPKHIADDFRKNDLHVLETRMSQESEEIVVHADGSLRTYISLKFPLSDSEGQLYGLCGISTDITQSKKLEHELDTARRMEALGVLAGGIAHDFNNILGVILMHSENLPGAETIKKSAQKASDLTRKLLVFGQKQTMAPRSLDLNGVIRELQEMLTGVLGADIRMEVDLDPGLSAFRADPSQVEQVLMNLALNSRDAMPRGGQLLVSTRNVELGADPGGRRIGVLAGNYVELKVQDSGCGMSKEIQERIFEPFFTTKGKDKGTGLGLPSVYGIVQQSGGDLLVESEVGKGTVIRVFFPQVSLDSKSPEATEIKVNQTLLRGSETLLVIDDEDDLREITARQLRKRGFTVLEAANARQAEEILRNPSLAIQLIVSDVIMPEISGPQLMTKLDGMGILKETKVLFVSGYSDNKIAGHGISHGSVDFLEKPYLFTVLLQKIITILARN